MTRYLLIVTAAIALVTNPATAGMPAPPRPTIAKFAHSDAVVTGKVTAIEKDTIDATWPYVGAKDKVAYKVAVVKIESAHAGATNLTHIKVGFVPNPKPDPNAQPPRRPRQTAPDLEEGAEVLLFLVKHPTADFYVMPTLSSPAYPATASGNSELELVKKFAAVLADPMKGLKSDKADVRAETAALLVTKYRSHPELAPKVEEAPVGAEESKLILKGLAEGTWVQGRFDGTPNALSAFYHLGLTDKDGWKAPVVQPGADIAARTREAFVAWLAGPGKDYQIKKVVPKK